MRLQHTTLLSNLPSIRRTGLDPCHARQGRLAVWLHAPGRLSWACNHVAVRHATGLAALVTLTIDVPRAWLVRHARGVYWCPKTIPWARVVAVTTYHAETQPVVQE